MEKEPLHTAQSADAIPKASFEVVECRARAKYLFDCCAHHAYEIAGAVLEFCNEHPEALLALVQRHLSIFAGRDVARDANEFGAASLHEEVSRPMNPDRFARSWVDQAMFDIAGRFAS